MSNNKFRLNPSTEAFSCQDTLAIFAGDATVSMNGPDLSLFYKELKAFLEVPRTQDELCKRFPKFSEEVPDLISSGVLVIEPRPIDIDYYCKSDLHDAMKALLDALGEGLVDGIPPILLCFPDAKGLGHQAQALRNLRPGQKLLTGYFRGSSLYVLPLLDVSTPNLFELFERLFSSELGIGHGYLTEEMFLAQNDVLASCKPDPRVVQWIATDLYNMIRCGRLDDTVAHVYRGSLIQREDVSLEERSATLDINLPLEDQVQALEYMFVGPGKIINHYHMRRGDDDFDFLYHVDARYARTRPLCPVESERHISWGKGGTHASAKMPAFMEALERYAVGGYELKNHPLALAKDLDKPTLDMSILLSRAEPDVFTPDISPDEPRRWHVLTELSSGKDYYAPLEVICYPVFSEEAGYTVTANSNSSGVASHLCRDLAIESACRELVERDAFTIAWLSKAAPPLIRHDTLPQDLQKYVASLENQGFTVRFLNLSTEISPVVSVLLYKKAGGIVYAIGASSGETPEEVCYKAFREVHLCVAPAVRAARFAEETPPKVGSRRYTPDEHMKLYKSGYGHDMLFHLFGSSETCGLQDIKRLEGSVLDSITRAGLTTYIADIHCSRIHDVAPNVSVVRAIVPGLVPINFGHDWACTASPRIFTVPKSMGWKPLAKDRLDLQRDVHPFH